MPFLSTNQYGAGPLYQFGTNPGDRTAYLLEGVTYYQNSATTTNNYAIWMNLADSYLTVAGSIGSRGFGIRATAGGVAAITVTASGYVAGDIAAIGFSGALVARVVNDGAIVCSSGSGDAISVSNGSGSLQITNTGTIIGGFSAMSLDDEDDRIVNTGTIVGDVYLGNGSNRFETYLGTFSGTIFGGSGNDVYVVRGTETIIEAANAGNDRVTSYGDYALPNNIEDLSLVGDAHSGTGNALGNFIYATNAGGRLFGLAGDDHLVGGTGDDLLAGGGGSDELIGGDGDNVVRGGDGADRLSVEGDGANTLIGGDGDDEITAAAGADTIRGGAGIDAILYAGSTSGVVVNLTTGVVSGGWATGDTISGIEWAAGSMFVDTLTGSAGANFLFGYGGNDVISGLDGDDRLEGGAGADQLDGGNGLDSAEYISALSGVTVNLALGRGAGGDAAGDRYVSIENVVGSAFADSITGSDGANVLHGSDGSDTINGSKGADTVYGDGGDDVLSGGADADVFAFPDVVPAGAGWGDDLITAFQNGLDKISFVGSSVVHGFGDIVFAADNGDTLITVGADSIRLAGFDPALLDASDFVFG